MGAGIGRTHTVERRGGRREMQPGRPIGNTPAWDAFGHTRNPNVFNVSAWRLKLFPRV